MADDRKMFEWLLGLAKRDGAHETSEWVKRLQALADGCQARDSALQHQEGGDHYKIMAIQPVEYIHRNGLGFIEGCVVKYVSRWRVKGGIADLLKARHFLDLLMELEAQAAAQGAGPRSPSASG